MAKARSSQHGLLVRTIGDTIAVAPALRLIDPAATGQR
jgi:hypothetical protein